MVKSKQRAQPLSLVAIIKLGTLGETAGVKPEEGGDDVKSSWPLRVGLHTYYNGRNKPLRDREVELIGKTLSQSGLSLQLDSMKLESLVIADQQAAVNTFPGLVHTARHTTRVVITRSRSANRKEAAYQGCGRDWGEVVTR